MEEIDNMDYIKAVSASGQDKVAGGLPDWPAENLRLGLDAVLFMCRT